ncbi:hypothetical protein B0H13DRAFT_2334915 [Mycena leptocephala]|nr:hypothetical protein B0H13DRAFT_2334915 [Mycena leptocephala]
MSSLPSKNVSPLWAPFNHRCTEQLVELITEDLESPAVDVGLAAIPLLFRPGLRPRALQDCVSSPRLQGLLVPNQLPLGTRQRRSLVVEEVPPQPPLCPPPEDLPMAPSMDSYDEEEWYSFSTQSALYSPKDQHEQEQHEQREREKKSGKAAKGPPSSTIVVSSSSAAPPKRNTRSSTVTAPAPAKSARKHTASVVSEDSEANSAPDVPSGSSPAKPSRVPKKKVKIDVDEDEDKPVTSTSSSAAKGKGPATRLAKLTPDRIKKITQNLTDVLTRLVKDNRTDLVPTELNQINLFTETDSEYFVVLIKKRPSHVYKFSSHQPETSTNRTSKPDLAALLPISKPVALIPEETVTQVSFKNTITAIDSCLRCELEHKRCIPLGLGASCTNCVKERFCFCNHHLTLQEILDFHACVASDVIEADDKLPIFIAGLNDATLRLAAAAQTHADAVKSAEYYFAQLVDLTRRSIRCLSTAAFLSRFTRPRTPRRRPTYQSLIETYNRCLRQTQDLEQNAPYDVDSELTKRRLRRMFMLDETSSNPRAHHHRCRGRRGDQTEEQLSLLMACNYPQFVKQLGLFVRTAAVLNAFEPHKQLVAPINEIFEISGASQRQGTPAAITEALELGEEFHKLRVRAKANQNSLLEAARDKSRAEKDDAKKEAKKVPYNPLVHSLVKTIISSCPSARSRFLSAEAIQSDPEDSVIVVDEDTIMDDLLDAQGDDDLDSIDADMFMAEIDDAKKEKAKASTSKSAQKLNKPRAETVCIPYTHVGRLDRSSSAFVKAMNVIGKTDPKEAEKVASEAEASVLRKQRHAGSHYEYPKLTTPHRDGVLEAALEAVNSPIPNLPDRALQRIGLQARTELLATTHRLSFTLEYHRMLLAEQEFCILVEGAQARSAPQSSGERVGSLLNRPSACTLFRPPYPMTVPILLMLLIIALILSMPLINPPVTPFNFSLSSELFFNISTP